VIYPGFNANSATTSPTGWSTYSANGTASASYSEATSTGYNGARGFSLRAGLRPAGHSPAGEP
jgi:hypothetical protein